MGVPVVMIVLPLFAVVAGLNILNNVSANRATLIFLYIGINVPYTTIFLTTFFANLSRAFEEAAAIDGCPPVKTFWLIMLPMAQPGIVTVTIFNFINIWNEYFISLIFGNSDKVRPVAVGLYSMINSMKYVLCCCHCIPANLYPVYLPVREDYSRRNRRRREGIG